jgi:hypothetical protein
MNQIIPVNFVAYGKKALNHIILGQFFTKILAFCPLAIGKA